MSSGFENGGLLKQGSIAARTEIMPIGQPRFESSQTGPQSLYRLTLFRHRYAKQTCYSPEIVSVAGPPRHMGNLEFWRYTLPGDLFAGLSFAGVQSLQAAIGIEYRRWQLLSQSQCGFKAQSSTGRPPATEYRQILLQCDDFPARSSPW
jgi:hypothetical protein